MNLRLRRILYISFILFFFISAPMLVLYTSGYRYNFTNNKIVKTGLLILESKPQKVNVSIDKKLKFIKTPIKGKNLAAGLYEIEVSKLGYHTWSKKLEIKDNLSTFAQDIVLFKKSTPIKIINGQFSDFTLSPDNKKIVTLWQDDSAAEIWGYDLETQNSTLVLRISLGGSKLKILSWSSKSNNLLLKQDYGDVRKDKYLNISFKNDFWSNEDSKVVEINKKLPQQIKKIKWDDADNNIVYAQTNDSIYKININDQEIKQVLVGQPSDFIVYNKILYFDKKYSCLIQADKKLFDIQKFTDTDCEYKLTKNDDYELISSPRGLITLFSKVNKEITVIDLNNKLKIFQENGENISWNSASNKMLYYDDLEVATFSPSHHDPYKKEIVGRYSEKINKVLWHKSNHHLIILLNNKIKIVELDARDKRNSVDYNSFSELKNIFIDAEGKNIFVSGSKDSQSGIYQVNIF